MKKTKKKKIDPEVSEILEQFERACELEAEEARDAFEEVLRRARARWPTQEAGEAEGFDLSLCARNLAVTLQNLADWKRMYEVMKEIDAEGDAELLCMRAISEQHTSRLDDALRSIDRALEIDDDDADSHHEKACILCWKGDTKGAIASIRRSIEIDPDERPEKIRGDTDFEGLTSNAEFRKLVGLDEDRGAL